jgi:lysyl-tRNA synthetase class 2
MDRSHNPEFTMLEWYMAYADYLDVLVMFEELMGGLVRDLLGTSIIERHGITLNLAPPYARVSFVEGIRAECGLDVLADSEETLRGYLVSKGEERELVAALGGGRLLDEVFRRALEPTLKQPTFVLDYPVALSPLARRHRGDPRLTERFEFFVLGKELGNAFSELNDADDQRARFEEQVRQQAAGDDEAQQFDADYVRALEFGMPPTGGIGVGIDRLVMLLADEASIRDVILFPAMRPESDASRPDPA